MVTVVLALDTGGLNRFSRLARANLFRCAIYSLLVDAAAGPPDFDPLSGQPGLGEHSHGFGPAVRWGHKSGHQRNAAFSRPLLRHSSRRFRHRYCHSSTSSARKAFYPC